MTTNLIKFFEDRLPFYIDMLKQMVDINSFTANAVGVNRLGALTSHYFMELGFSPNFVQSVNPAFGKHLFLKAKPENDPNTFPGDHLGIALVSHLDTVFSPEEEIDNNFRFRSEGDRVYGPGTVDIKGGTVMIFALLDALKNLYPGLFYRVNWMVGLDASEETLSEDFGELLSHQMPENSKACLVFEGGTPNRESYPVVTSRKGRAEFRVRAEGRGAHAGNYHKQGANAIVQLADTIRQIASLTDYENQLTFNVGVVNGGSVVNRVPHLAEAFVEMRAFAPEVFQNGVQEILSLDGSTSISSYDGFPCRISVQKVASTDPWPRNPLTESLYQVWKAAGEDLGINVLPEERGGLSDGNLLWRYVPVLDGLGPAGNNAHCSERSADGSKEQEYMLIPSFIPKAILNIRAMLNLLGENQVN